MKLLISTYACAPDLGSEQAVGWNWTTGAHKLGHQVWALASTVHRAAIEGACRQDERLAGINWIFPEVAGWPLSPGVEPVWERTYNLLWQFAALRHARALHRAVRFDAIHHLTWGGVRAPTFLGALGAPLIVGPVGGGEASPAELRDCFTARSRLIERLRDLSNASITINPITRIGLAQAKVIFMKTPDTARLLTAAMRKKSKIFMELTLQRYQIGAPRTPAGPPRLLFAGRLLYWKGAHIAVEAFARLLPLVPEARLTIVGKGPEGERLKAQAAALKLGDRVEFVPWLPQAQLFALYADHHLLLFPSLHDSSGNVVLEALSRGLPVMCLALGGPRDIVTPEAGIVVDATGRDTAGVAAAMADEMARLFAEPGRLADLSAGAVHRASEFIAADRIDAFYRVATAEIGALTETALLRDEASCALCHPTRPELHTAPVDNARAPAAEGESLVDVAQLHMQDVPACEARPTLVSVIIPTLHRPTLLRRALESVFRQSWRELEAIVVVDGPDAETIALLQTIEDPRLRVIQNSRSLTAAGARNAGIDLAGGEWIAFLDDDDEWMPEKLARQLAYANSRAPALITCLSRVVTSGGSFVRPEIIYDNLSPIDEYLFDRRSPFSANGFIQTSTYLLPRALCGDLRFRDDNPHDDWDFLLRLCKQRAVRVETVPEVLAKLYVDDGRPSLSKSGTWLASLQWVERMRPLLTPRAYGSLCLSVVGSRAAKESAHSAGPLLLYRAFRHGSPRLWRAAAFLAVLFASSGLPRRARPTLAA